MLLRTDSQTPFLRAQWRYLAMLNFEVDPAILRPLVPRGTELDGWEGHTYLSVVGFLFLQTRVLGAGVPCHRDFEEVNLRFYVRRRDGAQWRRAVVFIKGKLVPRRAVALIARRVYNENYIAVPMRHELIRSGGSDGPVRSVSYTWSGSHGAGRLAVEAASDPRPLEEGSFEEFIAEHYWGYTIQRDGGTMEYRVDHPPWRAARAVVASLECDAARLYGEAFGQTLSAPPASALLAEGSDVAVFKGVRLDC